MRAFWAALAAIILAGAAVITVVAVVHARSGPSLARPEGIPASVSDAQINLMGLSPVPVSPAPGFTLTDQEGRTLSLSSLRGKVVVLEFMDPHCTDICPIVSQEYVDAYRDLGPLARQVVFAAVNVNQYHAAVADMMAYSREQQLTTIPSWHFFTGPLPDLRKVWDGYEITVQAPSPNADIVHTSAVYFIDPAGREELSGHGHAADVQGFHHARLQAGADDELGGAAADVHHQPVARRRAHRMGRADVDQPRLLAPRDHLDRESQRLLRALQEGRGVLGHAHRVGGHRAHPLGVELAQPLAEAAQRGQRALLAFLGETLVLVQARAQAHRLPQGIQGIDLRAMGTFRGLAHQHAKAVGA